MTLEAYIVHFMTTLESKRQILDRRTGSYLTGTLFVQPGEQPATLRPVVPWVHWDIVLGSACVRLNGHALGYDRVGTRMAVRVLG